MDFVAAPLSQEKIGQVYGKNLEDLDVDESKFLESFDYWSLTKPSFVKKEERQVLLSFGVKRCGNCGEVKGVGEFAPAKRNSDGKQGRCRGCVNKLQKDRYWALRDLSIVEVQGE